MFMSAELHRWCFDSLSLSAERDSVSNRDVAQSHALVCYDSLVELSDGRCSLICDLGVGNLKDKMVAIVGCYARADSLAR